MAGFGFGVVLSCLNTGSLKLMKQFIGAERCGTETSGTVLPCDRSKAWQSRWYFIESNPLNFEGLKLIFLWII